MPYHKEENHSGCPEDKPLAVVKDDDGEVMGCHPTEEAADEQLAALHANEPEASEGKQAHAVKLLHESPDFFLVGGYGHVWGDPKHTDLVGDYFTPESDLMPDLVPVKLIFYDHAMSKGPDGGRFDHVLGKALENMALVDDVGKWVQAQIDKRRKYVDAVMELVDRGIVAWSSGAVPHLVKRAKDGFLAQWPVVEYTLTTTPAEPRSTNVDKLKLAYKSAGLDWLIDRVGGETEGPEREGDDLALAIERERTRLLQLSVR